MDPASALSVNLLTRMSIDVRIEARQSALFVIDTGAERTVLAIELARAMALPAGPRVLVRGVTSDQVADTVWISTMEYGHRQFRNLLAPVLPRAALGADGLIGLDTLGLFELHIDFVNNRVVLRPGLEDLVAFNSEDARAGRLARPATRAAKGRFGQLLLRTEVEGVGVDAFVDSGSQMSIGNLALEAAIGGNRPDDFRAPTPVIVGVSGDRLLAVARTVSRLRLARRSLGPTPLVFADLNVFAALGLQARPALLLGADILTRFETLDVDYPRGRISLGRARRLRRRAV